ncbi:MAG: glycogen debranching protein GlgX [Methylibium sp.]|uniref:glycogen debranching protein GlgX n=1 Tax=Methylibium sp. TaxID=2067992 RepID=UPI00185A4DE6|nr:glycogen debranching protein GlgX [Methylibium sp.]MBA3595955.1 glycogen debranching protein GlgX [Methylibium sp.]
MSTNFPTKLDPGTAYPLGATPDGNGVNFAVFSANASSIELCLFDAAGRREVARLPLPECTDGIWHGYLPDAGAGLLYGYRAYGPYEPHHGHRFNHHKLLLDPYARQLFGSIRWTDALYGYRLHSPRADLSFDRRDSAQAMPKAVVVDAAFNWRSERRPNTPFAETVIYEAHVRGMTMGNEKIRTDQRGSFAALADPSVIDHLHRLGVTALELLPVHAFVQDRRLVEKKLRNYWGYNTLSYFAPEPRYLASGQLDEMRNAIRRLHAAGIEVILDVVYNHTAEESELGPTLSFRGLDNASYYRLQADNPRHCINDTGCGNTVNMSHPRVIQMVMDSLRYWVDEFHVDGFRFDLGVTLGREVGGFDPGSGFFDAIGQDPTLARVKLIAEPWDLGPGGYQIGNHPAGFAEWNGRFRDDVRRFWRGNAGLRGALAARLYGSADMFNHDRRRPWASLNFITAHDGFPLHDLVRYNEKQNEANGEDNRDGSDHDDSFNWGVEGPSEYEGIEAVRGKVVRAMLATLMFSNGTPMLLGGDEFGRTQQGNNNAYCQDNELSWLDWDLLRSEKGQALIDFTARLIEARQHNPTLRAANYLHDQRELGAGIRELSWLNEHGEPMQQSEWDHPEGRLIALRRARTSDEGYINLSLVLINGAAEPQVFRVSPGDAAWQIVIDSAHPGKAPMPLEDDSVEIEAHSVVLLTTAGYAPAEERPEPMPDDEPVETRPAPLD